MVKVLASGGGLPLPVGGFERLARQQGQGL
jgi:hypothetical protein